MDIHQTLMNLLGLFLLWQAAQEDQQAEGQNLSTGTAIGFERGYEDGCAGDIQNKLPRSQNYCCMVQTK